MSKQYTYRVTEPRFHNGVLYRPQDRDTLVTDKPFPPGTRGLESLGGEKAVAALKKQKQKAAEKKKAVAEGNDELAKAKGMKAPDFSGGKPAKKGGGVVTL